MRGEAPPGAAPSEATAYCHVSPTARWTARMIPTTAATKRPTSIFVFRRASS